MLLGLAAVFLCAKLSLAIIGGRRAEDYPFFALVHRGDHRCGGTVVAKDVVITAAHCLYVHTELRWATALEVYVLHGYLSRADSWDLRYHSCQRFIVHFGYEPLSKMGRGLYDVALVKLEDEVRIRNTTLRTITRFCSIDSDTWRYRQATVIGLGLINENPIIQSRRLKDAVLGKIDCRSFGFNPGPNFEDVHYCYVSRKGTKLTKGDYGGPLIFRLSPRTACLVGVASFSVYSSSMQKYANVFMSAHAVRPWFNRILKTQFADNSSTVYWFQ